MVLMELLKMKMARSMWKIQLAILYGKGEIHEYSII